VVEITNSHRYQEALSIAAAAAQRIELRAANGCRPTLVLTADLALSGGADSEIALNGLLLAGGRLQVPAGSSNVLRRLNLLHCTLVPGGTLTSDGQPVSPNQPSLLAEIPDLAISLQRCISGGLRVDEGAKVKLTDCIIDACNSTGVAYAAIDGAGAGADFTCEASTVIGKVHAKRMPLVSNSILHAELVPGDSWPAPVVTVRRQEGCLRFSYVPAGARVPRQFHCVPDQDTPDATVQFVARRYGHPAYAQLWNGCSAALLSGADDEGQMGAFHHVHQPQRETNLRVRLQEYLRVGLEAGIFYDS
jgi:hypothetical protein